ncbi:MAG: chromosomal replication initiator protein DnaA [Treponema sp.]|jgi:chromosomal replication initiator protein|nr:chromosomal replication initiator protein DnaA [Treponema sp.]
MADWNYEIFWKETVNQIKSELPEQEFAMWFNLEYLSAAEESITIAVPSIFYRNQIKQRYQHYIETKLKDLTGKKISVFFEVKKAAKLFGAETPKPTPKATVPVIQEKKTRHPQLREDYTFDKYIIGDNNAFAVNAAQAVAKNPGAAYNPFLIFGGVGLGKTHLMQAIGNFIYENSSNKIIYISAENFTSEFIQSVKEGSQPAFKNKYRHVDVLLIDDIHFLENKLGTQEELFFTYEALYNAKKQIIFAVDRPVSELKNLTDRLRNRFERGLKADLKPPDYETRCAILKKKIEELKVTIPDEVVSLIGKNVSSNVRDLESALTTLTAYVELMGKPITLEIAQKRLKDIFAPSKQTNISIDIIQRVVAEDYNLYSNDLKGKKRTATIVFPRQLAMYIIREITEFSTTEIGQTFGGRDHTTVMHACQKIEERIRSDPALNTKVESLKRKIIESNIKP